MRIRTFQQAANEHILTDQSGTISGGRARSRAGDRRGGQEAGGFTPSARAEESIHSVACGETVEWQQHERRSGRLLHPERLLHDSGSEAEEQERRWLLDHHQTPQELLALSMTKSMGPMLLYIIYFLVLTHLSILLLLLMLISNSSKMDVLI